MTVSALKSWHGPIATVVVIACLLLTACASPPPEYTALPAVPELAGWKAISVDDVDLLAVTPEMQDFVDLHLQNRNFDESRAWKLAYVSLDPWVLDFRYDPAFTLTGTEAFEQRQGNCLTFSSMFVAMARYAGLNAWFQEVKLLPQWSSENDTVLVSMHVNAVLAERGKEYVVDVSRRDRKFSEIRRRMHDSEALAQYYNNLGADALVAQDLPLAHAYFKKSVETRPGLAYVWSNLGVVFKRNGQTRAARSAYNTALHYEPNHTVSLNNLYGIYEESGDIEKAEALAARVERARSRNPYYINFLAQVALDEDRLDEALALSMRAVRMEDREYRFHYTRARSLWVAGDTDDALRALEHARELAPTVADAQALQLPVSQ